MDVLKTSEDDGQLWSYILSGLGYDEMQPSPPWQSCYKKMAELIRLNAPYFSEYGHKYYNTLRIQALAPAESVSELCEIIYSFYKNNLESQYDRSDTAFDILTENIQKRLRGAENSDNAQISFGASFWSLKSSLKYLLSHEATYMAAVCDAVAGKIDMLLRGDRPALNANNRWDILLQEWYSRKTDAEKKQMQNTRRKRVNAKVASKKEQIKPYYRLEDKSLFLCLPSIRLPEITQRPTLKIFQNNNLVAERKLSVYGNKLCYTVRECPISLIDIEKIHYLTKNSPQKYESLATIDDDHNVIGIANGLRDITSEILPIEEMLNPNRCKVQLSVNWENLRFQDFVLYNNPRLAELQGMKK